MKKTPTGYTYRQHRCHRLPTGWQITGPACTAQADSLRQAARAIDETPGTPDKLDRRQAGKLGAQAFYQKYQLQPYQTSDFAIVRREDGQIINTLRGGLPWNKQ